MEQNIIECNKLIAEFMGFDGQHEEWCGNNIIEWNFFLQREEGRPYNPNIRWDDLMPVVEKIKDIDNCADIKDAVLLEKFKQEHKGNGDNIFETSILCHLEEVYNRAIIFIQWYNKRAE